MKSCTHTYQTGQKQRSRVTKEGNLQRHTYTTTCENWQKFNTAPDKVCDVSAEILQNGAGKLLTSVLTYHQHLIGFFLEFISASSLIRPSLEVSGA